jgi:hypothetical protein
MVRLPSKVTDWKVTLSLEILVGSSEGAASLPAKDTAGESRKPLRNIVFLLGGD